MPKSRLLLALDQFRTKSLDIIQKAEDLTHGWFGILVNSTQQALQPSSVFTAAAIAYFALLSLFPFALLSITIASYSVGPFMDQNLLLKNFEFVSPAISQLLGSNIDEIIRARSPVSILALLGLLWSSSTFFFVLTGSLNDIWEIKRHRPFWRRRGLSILIVLSIVGPVVFLVSISGSVMNILQSWLPDLIPQIGTGVTLFASLLLDITLFMLLYMILPRGRATWREIFPGAIGAGLLWEIAKKAFLYFVTTYISVSNLIYGSVAAIIAFQVWAYFSGIIFLFGAYVNANYYKVKHQATKQI